MEKNSGPLEINFGKGGIEVLLDGVARVHAIEARTHEVETDCMGASIDVLGQKSSLWPSIMKFAKNGEYSTNALFHAN